MSALLLAVLKRLGKDQELPLRLAAAVVFGGVLLGMLAPIVDYIKTLMRGGALSEYAEVLLTALGVAILTGVCAHLCREWGESGIATYLELAGQLELLLLCLPLLGDIFSAVSDLLS